MKVYELMKALENISAGSEVKFKKIITDKELENRAVGSGFSGEKYYNIVDKVERVGTDREGTTVLYGRECY